MDHANLEIEETGPGYQDRKFSEYGKFMRYIDWLLKDLEELPDDPRTLYYLGDSYKGAFMAKYEQGTATQEDEWLLHESLRWYFRRWEVRYSHSVEERLSLRDAICR
eukprot:gb/GECG01000935.1/.p1 GENE.gb/GECG01000935.1/~~gb/GECG01000935.1/.p1  ORF type:complete len:107 (+),score=17.29 gb/GECG01000935.1/:1-321(+)